MMTKEHFEENAVSLIEDIGSFDASEDVIRHCYGEDAVKQFKAFIEGKGWVMYPNLKSRTIHVERAKVVA